MIDEDRSGRKKILPNVITSWLSQFVFIAFGFILPRAIDDTIGQVSLGIWDFGWTIVSYLNVAMVGIGASVNRHVARYRASGEGQKLSSSVSSVVAVQCCIGSGVFLVTVLLYFLTPSIMGEQLGERTGTAAFVVLFLGSSVAVQMVFDAFRGILTGCHRWTTHNVLNAGGYAVTATSMLLLLANGYGLEGMATAYLGVTVVVELLRFRIARAACPEIELSLRHVNRTDIGMMVRFGIKNVLIYLPRLIITQTISLFVILNLGAAMLAVLSRPLALVAHISTLMNKFAFVLTPVAGSLQGSGQIDELKQLAINTVRIGWFFALLPTTFLIVLGDRVIELWMGVEYINREIIIILSAGAIFPVAQRTFVTILIGMDEHGRIAKYSIAGSAIVVLIGLGLVHAYGWSLAAAAWLIVASTNIGIAAVTLIVGCRVLGISAVEYMRSILRDPILLCVILLSALYAVRIYGPQTAFASFCVGAIVHALVAGVVLRKELYLVWENVRRKPVKAAN